MWREGWKNENINTFVAILTLFTIVYTYLDGNSTSFNNVRISKYKNTNMSEPATHRVFTYKKRPACDRLFWLFGADNKYDDNKEFEFEGILYGRQENTFTV